MSCKKCGSLVTSCGCPTTCPECSVVCAALVVNNAWNVPACNASAVLSVPGLTFALIGSYVWNPTYGWFRITGFDSVNGQLTVINECLSTNAAPGSVVPALTQFVFGAPPGTTNITYVGISAGTAYTLTAVDSPLVFGTTQASITIATPGTYLILPSVSFNGSGLTVTNATVISASLRRQNNTPTDVVAPQGVLGGFSLVAYTGVLSTIELPSAIYTTLNSNDLLNIQADYVGAAPGAGSFTAASAKIVAVKLS